jgi:hypothetical protein
MNSGYCFQMNKPGERSVRSVTWQQTRIRIFFILHLCHNICFPKHTDQQGAHSASYSLSITTQPNKMEVEHSSKLSNKVKNKWSYALLCHMSSQSIKGQLHLTFVSAPPHKKKNPQSQQ